MTQYPVCLHVTHLDALKAIQSEGLTPRVGPLASMIVESPGIWMFPAWNSMIDASFLWDEDDWPYESDPALLLVKTEGLQLDHDVGYELVCRQCISPGRITVLATSDNFGFTKKVFLNSGGLLDQITP
jgi:hypothetical protein